MTRTSTLDSVSTAVAALLVVPVVIMVTMLALMGLTGWGHLGAAPGGEWMLLMPVVPLVVLGSVAYLLYARVGTDNRQDSDEALDALRAAYARGDLSDEEFENRRRRLSDE